MVSDPQSHMYRPFRWPNDLVHFPADVQANLSSWLFSEDGL